MATRSRSLRTLALGAMGLVILLLLVAVVRTLQLDSRQVAPGDSPPISVAPDAHEKLSRAIQFKTVTKQNPAKLDSSAYRTLYQYLETAFPLVHRTLDVRSVHGLSRFYTWPGTDTTKAPLVLMAHVDVVPIEPGTHSEWTHPPFSGAVAQGHVWGRGALDDKASVVGILEALSTLIRNDVQLSRTVHVAFGHDEEVGGPRGAKAIAERITADGSRPIVVDEGGAITKGALPGLDRPLAVVGIAEKGFLSIRLKAEAPGGHSSAPPDSTSIEILNAALTRLLDRPFPSRLDGVTGRMLEYVAPEMSFPLRLVLANRWLTAPAVRWALNRNSTTKAAIRTVQVPTRLNAGVKDNVIPTTATATINYRILPSQSIDDVLAHAHSAVGDLPVTIETLRGREPSPVSDVSGQPFHVLQRTIREVTSDSVVVAPYLVPGGTDSRHYADATDHVYRFLPYTLTPEKRGLIHGTNERISIDDYRTVVKFYVQLLRNADALSRDSAS